MFLTINSTPTLRRRFLTGIALLAYVLSVCGYPTVELHSEHDASVAFPCQGHACGCHSAAQCWQNCCCFTKAEHVAWAQKHNVTVPVEVLAQMSEAPAAPHACCDAQAAGCEHHDDAHESASASTGATVTWTSAIEAKKCRGQATEWTTSGANIPLTLVPLWQFDWTPQGHVCLAVDHFFFLGFAPPLQPPQA